MLFTKIFKKQAASIRGSIHDLKQPNSSLAKIPILMYLASMSPIKYDALYKKFFTHPAMIEALMRDFVPTSLVEEIDFSTLRRLPQEHIGRDYRKKLNDIVWQLDLRGNPCYIIIMLEFQRKNDRWMALRLLTYIALLWDNMLREGRIQAETGLPPVFPIVIYNGKKSWNAPLDIKSLLPPCPPILSEFQASLRYFLIDELRVPDEQLKSRDNLASLFFFLQRCNLLESGDELRRLERILNHPGFRELTRTFAEWICHAAYEAGITETVERFDNIREVNAMLLENAPNWKYEYIAIGREEGREEGRELGREEGREVGREEGREEALETTRIDLREMLHSMIHEKFGPTTTKIYEKLSGIYDIKDLCGLAKKVPSIASPDKLNEIMDEIISRKESL